MSLKPCQDDAIFFNFNFLNATFLIHLIRMFSVAGLHTRKPKTEQYVSQPTLCLPVSFQCNVGMTADMFRSELIDITLPIVTSDDISIECLAGEDGSGKTTLMAKLQGTDHNKKGRGLEYLYLSVHDEDRDGEFTCCNLSLVV